MTAEQERRIRERAYSIWEQEGRPQGRDLDHRLRAEAEIAAEGSRRGDTAHQDRASGDDRERLTAREAAEALFTPNREVTEQSTQGATAGVGEPVRKPRVLAIVPPAPGRDDVVKTPISPKQQDMKPKIARSHIARIRTLVRYGMTARQVAEVYGVDVDEISRILRRS